MLEASTTAMLEASTMLIYRRYTVSRGISVDPRHGTLRVCAYLYLHVSNRWLCTENTRLVFIIISYICLYAYAVYNSLFISVGWKKPHGGVENCGFNLELVVVRNSKIWPTVWPLFSLLSTCLVAYLICSQARPSSYRKQLSCDQLMLGSTWRQLLATSHLPSLEDKLYVAQSCWQHLLCGQLRWESRCGQGCWQFLACG